MSSNTSFSKDTSTVCIVGGGNAGHVLAAVFPHRGIKTYWLASYADEAERISAALKENKTIKAEFPSSPVGTNTVASSNSGSEFSSEVLQGIIEGAPLKVSKNPADVVPDSNVLLLPVPSFAYESILREIKPYLRAGQIIGVTPGQGGFDWLAKQILGEELFGKLFFFALLPMPLNCRIEEFGKRVRVATWKRNYKVGFIPSNAESLILDVCNQLFGKTESVGHFLSVTLYPINAILHPSRLYDLLGKDYKEGDVLKGNPLFYEDMKPETIAIMDKLNADLIEVGKALKKVGIEVTVKHVFDFLSFVYGKHENLLQLVTTNPAYKGFRCPFKIKDEAKDEWLPDFTNRYFTEDIPMGLCVYKGVADLVGCKTPFIDEVIQWAQKHMKKEYIVDGKLAGKDMQETSAPQKFGITSLEGLR